MEEAMAVQYYDRPISEIYIYREELGDNQVEETYDPTQPEKRWWADPPLTGARKTVFDVLPMDDEGNVIAEPDGTIKPDVLAISSKEANTPNVPSQRWRGTTDGRNKKVVPVPLDLSKLGPFEKIVVVQGNPTIRDMKKYAEAATGANSFEREALRLLREIIGLLKK